MLTVVYIIWGIALIIGYIVIIPILIDSIKQSKSIK